MPASEERRDQAARPAAIARRLILRPGAIGDAVVSLPALEHLRAPETEVWAPTPNLPLFAHLGKTLSLASSGIDSLTLSDATLARLREFDEIVSWYGSARDDFRTQVEGLPFRFFDTLPAAGYAGHACDFYLAQVGAPPGGVPRLPVRRASKGYAVIHPFSGGRAKNWPLERFREVAQRLAIPVRWCAGPEEPLEEAVRFDDLGDLAQWLAGAAVYIGNDSGISHMAAACGVPVVALFGPSDPRVWSPRGERVAVLPFESSAEEVTRAVGNLSR